MIKTAGDGTGTGTGPGTDFDSPLPTIADRDAGVEDEKVDPADHVFDDELNPDAVDGEVATVGLTNNGENSSAIYIAIACIVIFVAAMCGICGYWYCHKMGGKKAKSVMISSTEIPTKLKSKKYRDHTQLSGMDDDLEDGLAMQRTPGGYDMSPLQPKHDEDMDDVDGDEEDEDEDEEMDSTEDRQQHDILE